MTSQTGPDVFVSYAADDSEVVLPIVDRLERDGVAIWVDRRRITGGMAWAQEIVRAMRRCKVLLLMCSDAALRSRAVAQEVQLAWKYRLAYLPVLLHPTAYTEQLEFFLEGSQWIGAYDLAPGDWIPAIVTPSARSGFHGSERSPRRRCCQRRVWRACERSRRLPIESGPCLSKTSTAQVQA
jgi:hypothetical protein